MRIEDNKDMAKLKKLFSKDFDQLETKIVDFLYKRRILTNISTPYGASIKELARKKNMGSGTLCTKLFGNVPSDVKEAFENLRLYSAIPSSEIITPRAGSGTLFSDTVGTPFSGGDSGYTYVRLAGDTMLGHLSLIDATAGTHAINRNTGDERYGRLNEVNTWNEANHFTNKLVLSKTTSSTAGVIQKGDFSWIHDFQHPTGGTHVPLGRNVFIGINAGNFTMGSTATSIGHASDNIAVGSSALRQNTIGFGNISIGTDSMYKNAAGSHNIALGMSALYDNISGAYNVALGGFALGDNIGGEYNTGIGWATLRLNTEGSSNTALGSHSLNSCVTGSGNTAIGRRTLQNTLGSNNLGVGIQALQTNTTGQYNTALGSFTLIFNESGDFNIGIGGFNTGSHTVGNIQNRYPMRSIYIGSYIKPLTDSDDNQIIIGHAAQGLGSNTVVIGNDSIVKTRLKGAVVLGSDNATSGYLFDVHGKGLFNDELNLTASLGSMSFASGFAGSGWRYDHIGERLTVDNLTVRKQLRIYELLVEQIRANRGSLVVSPGDAKIESIDSGQRVYVDTDGGNLPISVRANDLLRYQRWTGAGVRYYVIRVVGVFSDHFTYATFDGTDSPAAGDELVVVGNTTNTARQGLIYITSSDDNAPYIDILDGVSTASFAGKQKVRLGKLDGISDADFGGALTGYGLYSTNVFLKGKIVIAAGSSGVSNLTDAGVLASADTVDYETQVSGTKPDANATEGADWNTNLTSIPNPLTAPSGTGLFLSATHMGYYASGAWKTYIDNSGNMVLGNPSTGSGLSWDQLTATLNVSGTITLISGSTGIGNFTDAGALAQKNSVSLGSNEVTDKTADNISESTARKWAGESGADITSSNPQSSAWLTNSGDLVMGGDSITRLAGRVLDNIADGTTYARVLSTSISAGKILLSQATGTIDNIADGTTYGKVSATSISAGKIVLSEVTGSLDDIANGTYGKVLSTSISAGKIVLSQTTGDADDISEGTTNKFAGQSGADVTSTVIQAGLITTGRIILKDGSNNERAGIAGAGTGTDVSIWSGASHANRGTATFRVNYNGDITATSGAIGNWTISGGGFLNESESAYIIARNSTSSLEARLGSNVFPTTLGSPGLSWFNIDVDSFNNPYGIVSIAENAKTSYGAFAGYFKSTRSAIGQKTYALWIDGPMQNINHTIHIDNASYYLNHSHTVVKCSARTGVCVIYLPQDPYDGMKCSITRDHNSPYTVRVSRVGAGDGYIRYADQQASNTYDITWQSHTVTFQYFEDVYIGGTLRGYGGWYIVAGRI